MSKSCLDVKLNIKPVFCLFSHKYYYEGPCRMTGGDALQPGFDDVLNAKIVKGVMAGLRASCPDDACTLLESAAVTATDDWDIDDGFLEKLMEDDVTADAYFVLTLFGTDRVWREFGRKCKKPLIICPNQWNPMKSAYLFNIGAEVYVPYDWPEVSDYLKALRARKALAEANVLLVTRFGDTMALAGADDSFISLEQASATFGTSFRPVNFHELVEQMKPLTAEGNTTTPGRTTPNLTDDDLAELDAYADELISGAEECDISKEYLLNSLKAWKIVNKHLDAHDCSGCAIPCPDLCSTRRLNDEKFTFCLNHQLNNERGIASACKYDIAATLTMMAELCLSGHVPYMANTLPLVESQGSVQWIDQIPEQDRSAIEDTSNLYCVNMSPMMRKVEGVEGPVGPYAIRHFAYDQQFGAVFHRDFNADIGKTVTLARFSGDCRKLLVVKGEIVKGYGYDLHNCNGGFVFRVSDGYRLHKEQAKVGLMLPLVFGDITRELTLLAETLKLEVVSV